MKSPYLYLALSLAAFVKFGDHQAKSVWPIVLVFFGTLIWSICHFVIWIARKATHKSQVEQRNIAAQNMKAPVRLPLKQGAQPPLPSTKQTLPPPLP